MKKHIRMKPFAYSLLLCFFAAIFLLSLTACKNNNDDVNTTPDTNIVKRQSNLFGMIIEDDGSDKAYLAMHSFIRTCETVGKRAKLYRIGEGASLQNCIDAAKTDSCDAVVFCECENASAVDLKSVGILSVSLMCNVEDANASVIIDSDNYYEDVALVMCDKAKENGYADGKLLIYGDDTESAVARFNDAIAENGCSFTVISCARDGKTAKAAGNALCAYMEENAPVCGIFAARSIDAYAAVIAARNADGKTVVIGTDMTDTNVSLLNSDLYAVCIEPIYDASAQAVFTAASLISGDDADTDISLARHIVTDENIEKYTIARRTARAWFGRS